jgi:o-succinylbenzoate synthase
MEDKVSWFIKLWDEVNPEVYGVGECGPLSGLSLDARSDFEEVLGKILLEIEDVKYREGEQQFLPANDGVFNEIISSDFPAIRFGAETARLDLQHGGQRIIFKNDFLLGEPIPINGLIWMGGLDEMLKQVHKKVRQGFSCIKLKIGGLDFNEECALLQEIRAHYGADDVTIRLDANGAFSSDDALFKLETLKQFKIHSIEQPIAVGQYDVMQHLCQKSPIPIALDEELIPHQQFDKKRELLTELRPAYIILKPTLHGGIGGCDEWIAVAENMGIGWWITSALESNIGLNAICQYTANHARNLPQGLGTGAIYQNNIESPLTVSDGYIFYDNSRNWNIGSFFS